MRYKLFQSDYFSIFISKYYFAIFFPFYITYTNFFGINTVHFRKHGCLPIIVKNGFSKSKIGIGFKFIKNMFEERRWTNYPNGFKKNIRKSNPCGAANLW